jgi:hypothetical protein
MNSVSAETPITPLSVQANINSHSKSVVDGLGERDTSGVVASGFEFTHVSQEGLAPAGYELRLTNRLPVPVTSIRMRIIYYDASKAVMDFEEFFYSGTVPPGLTKIVDSKSETMEAGRAAFYYHEHGEDGREIQCASVEGSWEVRCTSSMSPKVELRIVGFDEDAAQ